MRWICKFTCNLKNICTFGTMIAIHKIESVQFEREFLILNVDNERLIIKLSEVSPKLANAPDIIRNDFKISPSGYGIHWSQLDEDLSIQGLIRQARKMKCFVA